MRLYLGAAAVVALILGGAWVLLALTLGHPPAGEASAFVESRRCVRHDRALVTDPADAARLRTAGVHTLGIAWRDVRAVALFDDSISAGSVTRQEARIRSALRSRGASAADVESRLLNEDDVALYYLRGAPSQAAETAIGRCVYVVHFNRVASFFGLYVSPHSERPFLPGARRER